MISTFSGYAKQKPSVTELTKLLDKPALLNWANKQGLQGIDINVSRKKYQSDGTSIHKQIEDFHILKTPFLNPEHEANYLKFIEDKEIIYIEQKVETDWFTGRLDCVLKFGDKRYIVDYKSNQSGVYLENKLQLVAYSMALHCDSFAIVSVPDFKFIEVSIPDRKPYIEIIKALSIVYQNKKIIE